MLNNRIRYEQKEKTILAPYAQFSADAKRVFAEKHDDCRTEFQRDCHRIYHCQAFRRMQGKRQVLPILTNDHIRTRLTHTLEVSQIARSLARTNQLNEDLTEAIALAHDLGHTPFAHAGQTALDEFMQKHNEHFEHNEQSLRVVTVLEKKSANYRGLNLTMQVLDGLDKHRTAHADRPNLEGQIVNLADEIAYNAHDLEDALQNNFFAMEQIQNLKIWKKIREALPENPMAVLLASRVINFFVRDLDQTLEQKIADMKPKSGAEIKKLPANLADFSPETREIFEELKKFLWDHYYDTPKLRKEEKEIQSKIMRFCDYLVENPKNLPGDAKGVESVKDYVAGMTDAYFEREYQKLIQ